MSRPPLVGKISERLLRVLAKGEPPPGGLLPPAWRLAEQFDVSRQTVMAAVRRLGQQGVLDVHEGRAVRVLDGAPQKARQLLAPLSRRKPPRRLAILIPDSYFPLPRNPFYATIVGHLLSEAGRRELEAAVVWWLVREQRDMAESLVRCGYDAAIFVGYRAEHQTSLCLLREWQFPVTVFNHEIPGLEQPTVIEDLYGAAQQIADRLVGLGHRNLCLVAHAMDWGQIATDAAPHRGMLRGWIDYLTAHGVFDQCAMPLYLPWEPPGYENMYDRTFRLILAGPHRPTAIVFAHSLWAKDFLLDRELAKLKVPAELSLATCETTADLPQIPPCPPLTNLEIDYTRVAQCLMELVDQILSGEPHPQTIRVPLELKLTESIGPPPQ